MAQNDFVMTGNDFSGYRITRSSRSSFPRLEV